MTRRIAPVSAVMPAYNAEPFIKEAIESVRAQTLPVAELIVVADGSTDRTVEIAESMGVQVFHQPNLGLGAARNRCVREASQPWIAFIDSDDIWKPEKIARQMEIVSANPDVALVTCDYSVFDRSGVISESILDKYRKGYEAQPRSSCEGGAIIDQLDPRFADAYYFLLPTLVMVRRNVLEVTGLFDESLDSADDFDCYMRVLANHRMAIAETVLARRREHENNASRRYTRCALSCLAVTYKVLENPESYPAATVKLCQDWLPGNLRHAGARLLRDGDTRAARELLLKSARLQLSPRTLLALAASITPSGVGRNLMNARYYVSKTLGI